MSNVKDVPLKLEARLMRLELIVEALEREDLELEEALRLFEEGIGHIRGTRELLAATELRIERLLDDGAGGSVLEPGTVDDEG
jgi:exodeoxyribonuclease VII small subunit